ncbi:hypothetical protein TREPR_2079 [Treponema primitia ZAS-2]|uniref:Ig-like domain-containing protein n=1 Tax=Treponema primitia (strain ATCC BAA-887 / DSM 12427 / ZAS-2) TaxID=545694 RepID=F5YJR0_TREPZ|nr:Ig-like domain repeat protein [Treponema primitia]AEF84647.1 hypothetical protein TREPR_2079 [Treponema primitia ZAS-2]
MVVYHKLSAVIRDLGAYGTGNWISGESNTLRGKVYDADEVSAVFYKIVAVPAAVPTESAKSDFENPINGWTKKTIASSGESNWSDTVNTPPLPEGRHVAYVAAFDAAGNWNANWAPAEIPGTSPVQYYNYAAYPFGVDYAAPTVSTIKFKDDPTNTVTLNDLATGVHRNTGFSVGGTVSDTHDLASITLRQVFVPAPGSSTPSHNIPISATYTQTPFGSDTSWTLDIPSLPRDPGSPSSLANLSSHTYDGTYTYTFTVTDITVSTATAAYPRTSTYTFTAIVDTTGPVVTISTPTAGIGIGDTTLRISGTNLDALSEPDAVWYTIDGNPLYSGTKPSPTSVSPFNIVWHKIDPGWVDPTASTPGGAEGVRYLHVFAYDRLGNESVDIVDRQFYLDTAPPVIDHFQSLDTTLIGVKNYAHGDYIIEFDATDSNALNTPNSVTITRNGENLPWSVNDYVLTISPMPTPTDTTSVHVKLDVTAPAQGEYEYIFDIKDIVDKHNTQELDPYRKFIVRVDTTPPKLTIATGPTNKADINLLPHLLTTPPVTGDVWIDDAAHILGGSVYDDDAVSAVFYKIASSAPTGSTKSDFENPAGAAINGWTKVAINPDSTWSSSITAPEGRHTLYVAVFDIAGNLNRNWSSPSPYTYTPFEFGVDATPPTLTANTPAAVSKSGFTLNGNVSDSNALHNLVVVQTKAGVTGSTIVLTQTTTGTWTTPSLPSTVIGDGIYTYTITATDKAGRTAVETRTVQVDDTVPTLGTTTLGTINTLTGVIDSAITPPWLSNNLDAANFTFNITVQDTNKLAAVYYKVANADPSITATSGDSALTGAGFTKIAFTGTNFDQTVTVALPASSGLYKIYVAAIDAAGNQNNNLVPAVIPGTGSPGTPYSGTNYTPFEFGVDKELPTVSEIINTSDTQRRGLNFGLSGTVGDGNALKSLVITQQKDSGPVVTIYNQPTNPTTPFTSPTSSTWSIANGLPRDPLSPYTSITTPAPSVDGTYIYEITVTDIAGRTATETRKIKVDTTLPKLETELSVNVKADIDLNAKLVSPAFAPTEIWINGDANLLRGTVYDNDEIGAVFYKILPYLDSAPGETTRAAFDLPANNWIKLDTAGPGQKSWTANTAAITTEGWYKVYVAVFDAAGNWNNNWDPPLAYNNYAPLAFGVDATPPTLTANTPAAVSKSGFTLNGNVSDSNALHNLVVVQTKAGVTGSTIVLTQTTTGTWTTPSLPSTVIGDGIYTYTITATDKAGRTAVETRTVQVDDTVPTLGTTTLGTINTLTGVIDSAITPPWLSNNLDAANFTFNITVQDTNKLAAVYYKVANADPSITATSGDSALTGAGFTKIAFTGTNFDQTVTVALPASSGLYKIYVAAIDAAGNQNNNLVPAVIPGTGSPGTPYSGTNYTPFEFGVDKELPTVSEIINTSDTQRRGLNFGLSGTVGDGNALKSLVITQQKDSGPVVTIYNQPTNPTTPFTSPTSSTWSIANGLPRDPLSPYTSITTPAPSVDGTYIYEITVTDIAGRTATETRKIKVDTTLPKLETELSVNVKADIDLNAKLVSPAFAPTEIWINGDANLLRGTVYDNDEIGAVFYKILPYLDSAPGETTRAAFEAAALTPNNWIKLDTTGPGQKSWTATTAAITTEGWYKVYVAVFDAAGNWNNNWDPPLAYNNYAPLAFGVDATPPTLTANTPAAVSKSGFTLNGNVEDSNALESLVITQKKGSGTPMVIYDQPTNPTTAFTGGSNTWSISNLPTVTGDETYEYVITATDKAGRTTLLTRTVRVDDTVPTLGTIAVLAGVIDPASTTPWVGGTFTFKIPAADNYSLANLYYKIQKATDDAPLINAASGDSDFLSKGFTRKLSSGTSDEWSITINPATDAPIWSGSAIVEGEYKIYAAVIDTAGNQNNNMGAAFDFGVDTGYPTLVENVINTNDQVRKPLNFALGGTASDTVGLKSLIITEKEAGVSTPVTVLNIISFTNPGSNSWSVPSMPSTSAEGTYTYTITLTDLAGRTASLTRIVTVDVSPPRLVDRSALDSAPANVSLATEGNTISGVRWIDGIPNTLRGYVSDNDRIAALFYNIVPDSETPLDTTTYNLGTTQANFDTATASTDGWKKLEINPSNEINWAVILQTSALPISTEGKYTAYVAVFDAAGLQNNNWDPATIPGTASLYPYTPLHFGVDKTPPILTDTINTTVTQMMPGGFSLAGTIGDTNGLQILTVKQEKTGVVVDIDPSAINYDTVWSPGDSGTIGWTINGLPKSSDGSTPLSGTAASGTYVYTITVTDIAGKTTQIIRTVTVDTTPPKLGALGAGTGAAADVKLAAFTLDGGVNWIGGTGNTLRGIVSDDDQVDALFYRIQPFGDLAPTYNLGTNKAAFVADTGWKTLNISPTNEINWADVLDPTTNTLPIPINGVERKYKVYVVAFDAAGNQNNNWTTSNPYTANYLPLEFGLDLAPPTLTETTVGATAQVKPSAFSMGGADSDSYGLKNLVITQTKGSTTVTIDTQTFTTNPNITATTWSVTNLPRDPITPANVATGADLPGTYTYTITLTDLAGKTSQLTRTVTVDNTPPKLGDLSAALAAPANVSLRNPGSTVGSVTWINDATNAIRGTVSDDNRIAAVFYNVQKNPLSTTTYNLSTAQSIFEAEADGWKKLTITPSSEINWEAILNPNDAPIGAGTAGSAVEGTYKVYVAVFDAAGNQNNNWTTHSPYTYAPLEFGLDKALPTVTETTINTTATKVVTGSFAMDGAIGDTNGLASLEIKQQKQGGAEVILASTVITYTSTSSSAFPSGAQNDAWHVIGLPKAADGSSTPADPSGTYTYTITVTDIAGKTSQLTRTVTVDKTPPKLTIQGAANTAPATISLANQSNNYINLDVNTLRGTVSDEDQVAAVFYRIAVGSATLPTLHANQALFEADTTNWTKLPNSPAARIDWNTSLDPTALPISSTEGEYKVYVVVFDAAGNQNNNWTPATNPATSSAYPYTPFTFGLDNNPPGATAVKVNDKVDASTTGANYYDNDVSPHFKTGFSITGAVTDTNKLDSITLTQRKDGGAIVTIPLAVTTDYIKTILNTSWDLGIKNLPRDESNPANLANLSTIAANGVYTYTLTVRDVTGRTDRTVTKVFTVTIDTVGPVITVQNPSSGATATGTTLYINGTASDTHSPEGIAVFYKIDSSSTFINPSISNLDLTASPDPTLTDWTFVGGATWGGNPAIDTSTEGNLYLHLVAYDELKNQSATHVDRPFFVDASPPQIQAWTPAGLNTIDGYTYAGKDYTFAFNATDSNALRATDTVKIFRNGAEITSGTGISINVGTGSDQSKPVTVAFEDQADGNYTYNIAVYDVTGKENTLDNNTPGDTSDDHKNFTVIVDTTPPTTSLTMAPAMVSNEGMNIPPLLGLVPTTRLDNINGVIKFAASAMDNNGIDGVRYFFIPSTYYSSFNPIPASTQTELTTFYADSYGADFDSTYAAFVNTTTDLDDLTEYKLYVMAQDRAHNISVSTPLTVFVDQRTDSPVVTLSSPAMGSELSVLGAGTTVRGIVRDDDGILGGSLQIRFHNGTGTGASGWQNGTGLWTTIPVANITGTDREKSFTYTIPATGMGGDSFVKRVEIQVSDDSAVKLVTDPDTTPDTTNIIVLQNFNWDITPPAIAITPGQAETYKAHFAITGTVTEHNLDTFRVKLDTDQSVNSVGTHNDSTTAVELHLVAGGDTKNWTLTIPAAVFDTLDDGLHSVSLEATDKVGLTFTRSWNFYKDTTGPVVSFNNINEVLIPNSYTGNTLTTAQNGETILADANPILRGTFTDDYSTVPTGAGYFSYRFDGASDWVPGTSAGSGKNVSWAIPLTGLSLADGPHKIQIKVLDALGNEGSTPGPLEVVTVGDDPIWMGFKIDTTIPTITIIGPASGTVYSTQTTTPMFTLTGTAFDANLKEVSFTRDGNSATTVAGPFGTPDRTKTLSYVGVTKPVFDASTFAQGTHTITIKATDDAGRTASVDWVFIKDTAPPVVEFSNVAATPLTTFADPNPIVLGLARDTYGVQTLTSTLAKSSDGTSTGNFTDVIQAATTLIAPPDSNIGDTVVNWSKDLGPTGLVVADGYYRITINATDMAGNAITPVVRDFRIDRQSPTVAIDTALSVPAGTDPIKSFYNSAITISGTASDLNGIASVKAELDGQPWTATNATSTGDSTYATWKVTIPVTGGSTLPEGSHTLNVSATDGAGKISTVARQITYDKTPPTASFNSPDTGNNVTLTVGSGVLTGGIYQIIDSETWINGSAELRGVSEDAISGVASIAYHLGKLGDSETATDAANELVYNAASWTDTLLTSATHASGWSGGLYYWTYQNSNFSGYSANPSDVNPAVGSAFFLPFYIKVSDQAGNIRVLRYNVAVDPDLDIPQVAIANPSNGTKVGGEVRISGTATDDDWIYGVQIRIIDTTSNAYYRDPDDSWINGDPVGPPTAGNQEDGWVWATIVGNTDRVVAWYYNVNADGALSPPTGALRPVTIQVRAVDTQVPEHNAATRVGFPKGINVEFDGGVPTITNIKVTKGLVERPYGAGMRAGGTFTITADVTDEGGIKSIKARQNGESLFTDMLVTLPTGWQVTPPTNVGRASWAFGKKYHIITPGSASQADWEAIDLDYSVDKVYADGTMIRAKIDGSSWPAGGSATAYEAIGTTASASPTDSNWDGQFFKYSISFIVDSTSFFPLTHATKLPTGNYILDLQVTDNNTIPAPFVTLATINIAIDNFYPETTITTQYSASTSQFYVSGIARDYSIPPAASSGPVQGVERVLVYFQRGTNYLNASGQVSSTMTSYSNVKNFAAGGTIVPTFNNFPVLTQVGEVWKSVHAMVIDKQEIGATTDSDGDGTFAEMFDGTPDKEWQARFDTTINALGDGPLTVHYVVMDLAGNASHYQEDIYIRNNPPIIREFNLGTDINGDAAVSSWVSATSPGEFNRNPWTVSAIVGGELDPDSSNFGKITTNFTVRNLKLQIDLKTLYGNGLKRYNVTHVTQNGTATAASALTVGQVYTINTEGNTRWTRLGAPSNLAGTTFVALKSASASDGTSGDAYGYTQVATTTPKAGNFASSTTHDVTVSYSTGTDFTGISDSLIGDTTTLMRNKLFIVKVYDSTTGGAEAQQLAQAAVFSIDVDNVDQTPPKVVVNPFYWNNASDNSLYGNSKDNGHIELEADLPSDKFTGTTGILDKDPKVSGQISIRGSAEDNNILGSLWFYMEGFSFTGAANTISDNGRIYAQAASYTGGVLTGAGNWATNGWHLTVEPLSHDQEGHKVNWRLDLDTSKIADYAASDRAFRVIARDSSNTPSLGTATQTTTAAAKTPYYRMDVVPYISKISTGVRNQGGLKDNNIRSADGKYSVIQGSNANFITVTGFNLRPIANGVRILTAAQNDTYNPATTGYATVGTALTFTGATATGFSATNASTKSGYLAVYSGTTTAPVGTLNNINANDSHGAYTLTSSTNGLDQENMPNREADRYNTKNIRLTDDRYLQFYTVKQTDVKNGYYPVMLMEGDNPVFGYLDLTGGSSGTPAIGANKYAGTYQPTHAMPQRTRFDLGTGARQDTEYLIKASIWDTMGMARDESGRYIHATTYNRDGATFHLIYDRYAELHTSSGLGWGSGTGYSDYNAYTGYNWAFDNTNNAIALETVNLNALLLDRYQYPKIIAKGNSATSYARYYMTYFDNQSNQLIFRNFRIGVTTDVTETRQLYHSGLDNKGIGFGAQSRTNLTENTGTGNTTWSTGRLEAASGASNYFDMAVTSSTNIVVIAYYDKSDGRLKIKYSSGPVDGSNPTAPVTWTNSPVNASLPYYVGTHVSMVMDANDGLHIAAFDAIDSDLKYIYIPDHTANSFTAVTVDQYASVGNWTQIKLHPSTKKPYIAYYNATETGGHDSIKMAYAKDAVTSLASVKGGVDANGYTTGDWEYMTVPAMTEPQGGSTKFQKVNLDFTSSTNGYKPVLGYLSDFIEFSYPVNE